MALSKATGTKIPVIVFSSIGSLVDALSSAANAKGLPLSFSRAAVPQDSAGSSAAACADDMQLMHEAEIAVADPPDIPAIYAAMPNLQWVQSTWAGVDGLFKRLAASPAAQPSQAQEQLAAATQVQSSMEVLQAAARGEAPPPFTLTRCGGQFGPLMAEYVIGHTVAWVRQFSAGDAAQAQREWTADALRQVVPLSQLTLGVLGGSGGIAASVLAAAKLGFGMRTVAHVSSIRDVPHADEVVDTLHACMSQCDVIVQLRPSTPHTRGLLDGDVFQACSERQQHADVQARPGHLHAPLFINAGRGDVVSPASVVSALDRGWLGHAVLDVFATEPLPAESKLWAHKHVTITPHVAAVSLPSDVAAAFTANAPAFLAMSRSRGEQAAAAATGAKTESQASHMRWVVDWAKGY